MRHPHPFVKWNEKTRSYEDSVVYNKATGERVLCWPVDARELVSSGEYDYLPPGAKPDEPAPVAAATTDNASEPPAAAPAEASPIKRRPGRPRKEH